jgi:DHA1 family bicyclomycin/chloramphenicol resistance-like MFS transporter
VESARPGYGLVIVLGAISAIGPLSLDLYLPALPELTNDLGGSDAQAQLTLTGCMLGMAAGQLLIGPWSDRIGRRPPMLLGLALYVLASLACAVAPTIEVLIVFRVAQGLCAAAGIVVARAVVRDQWRGNDIAGVLSLLMTIVSVAPMLAPVLGGQLLPVVDWRGLFAVVAGAGAVLLALAWWNVPEPAARPGVDDQDGRPPTRGGLVRTLRDRVFRWCVVLLAIGGGSSFTYISASSLVLETQYGLSPQQFSFVFSINAVGSIAGGFTNFRLVRARSPASVLRVAVCVGALSAGCCLVASATGRPVGFLLVPLFAAVVANSLVGPNATAIALGRNARAAGAASGVVGTAGFLAGAAIAPVASAGGTATAVSMTLLMTSLLVSGCLVAWLPLRRALAGLPPDD